MKHTKRFAVIWATTLMISGWALSIAGAETVITVGATGSALGSMKKVAALYEKKHPGIRIKILPSLGSTSGIKAALGGGLDLALASRPLSEGERRQGAVEAEYARSPFVFITHSGINKKDITVGELERFFSDPAAIWPGGSRVRLILRPDKDIDTQLVRVLSPGMEKAMKAAHERPGMIMAITDQESTEAVTKTPGALGGATLGEIVSGRSPVNILTFNGVKPEVKNLVNGAYPLRKSFYLVTTSKTSPVARDFAKFINSAPAGKILSESGNMPVAAKPGK